MEDELKRNLLLAVNARRAVLKDQVGTSSGVPDASLITAYRNVFVNDSEGRIVLKDLLEILKFSEKGADLYHMAMRNVALEILTRCGIGVDDLVDTLLNGL